MITLSLKTNKSQMRSLLHRISLSDIKDRDVLTNNNKKILIKHVISSSSSNRGGSSSSSSILLLF